MNIEMIGAINRLYNNCFSGRALFTYEDPIGYTIKFEYPDRSAIRYFDKLADEYSQAKAALLNEHLCKYEESAVIFEKLGWTYEAKHMRQKKTVTNMLMDEEREFSRSREMVHTATVGREDLNVRRD